MKPPMRSDTGPEAWVLYDEQIARNNFKEYCINNNLFEHLPFLFNPEQKSTALTVLDKRRGLTVIPRSQVTSLVVIIPGASRPTKRRKKMEKSKPEGKAPKATPATNEATATDAPKHPKPKANNSNYFQEKWLLAAISILLILLVWSHFTRCNDCKPLINENPQQATVVKQPTSMPTKQPTQVVSEQPIQTLDHQKLVLVNKTSKSVQIGLVFNGRETSNSLGAGQSTPEINTRESFLTIEINGVRQNIPLKKGRVTRFAIQSAS